jgi:hypothetical protein
MVYYKGTPYRAQINIEKNKKYVKKNLRGEGHPLHLDSTVLAKGGRPHWCQSSVVDLFSGSYLSQFQLKIFGNGIIL